MNPSSPGMPRPDALTGLETVLAQAERERDLLLAQLGIEPQQRLQLRQQVEGAALLRLLLQELQQLSSANSSASSQGPKTRAQGQGIAFGTDQIWCDGAVLYRVEPCHRFSACCRLVPLNGVSTAPLRRAWCHTSGLLRVA
jgi:hypothetical protein